MSSIFTLMECKTALGLRIMGPPKIVIKVNFFGIRKSIIYIHGLALSPSPPYVFNNYKSKHLFLVGQERTSTFSLKSRRAHKFMVPSSGFNHEGTYEDN
jgi:hypothetical protein